MWKVPNMRTNLFQSYSSGRRHLIYFAIACKGWSKLATAVCPGFRQFIFWISTLNKCLIVARDLESSHQNRSITDTSWCGVNFRFCTWEWNKAQEGWFWLSIQSWSMINVLLVTNGVVVGANIETVMSLGKWNGTTLVSHCGSSCNYLLSRSSRTS